MKKISATIVAFLFAFCVCATQVNAASALGQILAPISTVLVSDYGSSDSTDLELLLAPRVTKCQLDYWDYTYHYWDWIEEKDIGVPLAICEDAIKFNYDIVVTISEDGEFLSAHIKVKEEDKYDDINVLSSNFIKGNNSVGGFNNWIFMQLTNLDMEDYDKVLEMLSSYDSFQMLKISESDDESSFSVLLMATSYCVNEGDTLSEIAVKKLTTVDELLRLNPQITNPNLIFVNDVLKIRPNMIHKNHVFLKP